MAEKNLFKKAAVFTDIHFGLKSNSIRHNQDCVDFIDWFIATAKEHGCETCLFLGDFHHNRSTMNILTLDYMTETLEKLSDAFEIVHFLPGNHDLYYKDKRDVQSAVWARHIPNINVINKWTDEGNVTIVPWLLGDDYKKIKKIKSKYVFGHFELPHFFMNAMVQMPEHGDFRREDFSGKIDHVFSGHFHKRQTYNNITYIGNAFPHNYADASDDERGMMVLEWDKPPKYMNWLDCPKYRVFNLSQLLGDAENILKPKMHVRVTIDIPISYEEANFIKETFVDTYNLREITLMPQKDDVEHGEIVDASFESVDQIVYQEIDNIESNKYSKETLNTIYTDL